MLKIDNKIKFENNCWIGKVDSSLFNKNEENRIKAVTDIASITKGILGQTYKDEFIEGQIGKRRLNLYNRLLTESEGKPSMPFEFIPQQMYVSETCLNNWIYHEQYKFGTLKYSTLYTNMRHVLNTQGEAGITKFTNSDDFKIIVGQVPWKVISHLRTHRTFSFLVESSRNKKYLNEVEFWYPSWWSKDFLYYTKSYDKGLSDVLKKRIVTKDMKSEEATMELSDRRLVKFVMCAWKQDTNSWDNLFVVRGEGSGTQSITKIVVNNIKKLIY